jgi:hypothetical protein
VVVAKIVDKRAAVATERTIAEVMGPAIRLCAEKLSRAQVLLAFPCLGTGKGSLGKPSRNAEAQLRAAAEALADWELAGEGQVQCMDLLMLGYDRAAFQRLLSARASVRAEMGSAWPCVEAEADEELQRLARTVRVGEAVLFVGSGLSAGAGLPSWWELIIRLLEELPAEVQASYRRADGEWKALTFDDYLDIASWHWIVQEAREEGAEGSALRDHRQHIRELFSDHATQHLHPTLAHYQLLSMPWHYVVTTNYDVMLERTLEAQRQPLQLVVTDEEIPKAGVRGLTTVIKFHGHAAEPDAPGGHDSSIVLTREEYEHFFDRNPAKALLLEALLLNHHFFFYGYSLSDFDLRMIVHRVGQMLRQERREAFAASLDRTHAPKRRFWLQRGVHLVEMEGESLEERELGLLRWLDALLEQASVVEAPFLSELDRSAWPRLERVHQLSQSLGRELAVLLGRGDTLWSKAQLQVMERLLDTLSGLGWRPLPGSSWNGLWRALARGQDAETRQRLLYKAAAAADSLDSLLQTQAELDALED